ncbi:Epidermal patterning factor-like protein 2 [Apostasia shenzhenica]|uniref:Epidermal patterning factor-like protein n=1 Tax=Apostasia shenzhenica TaxID=1088818 RepID=A0A2I0A4D9_9ASPA|nr:Epidermal patterning factor-like protein 2 [Apostasia shenzhenica]
MWPTSQRRQYLWKRDLYGGTSLLDQRSVYLIFSLLLVFSPTLLPCIGLAFDDEQDMVMERSMIGSRPPRCQGICRACGRCEAVQVPAVPLERHVSDKASAKIHSRDDDSSNYKPLSWKCKCGDVILNP